MVPLSPKAFRLDTPRLQEIREAFADRVREGLPETEREIRALPAFLPVPDGGIAGEAAVVDLGGTNVRAAAVSLSPGSNFFLTAGPAEARLSPRWDDARAFFDFQAALVRSLRRAADLPLGYCFSYPARVTPERDAILFQWTKELEVPGVVGRPVGALLRSALAEGGAPPRRVAVLNDTVAALLGGYWLAGGEKAFCDAIGLVVGTGTNLAAFFPAPRLGDKARGRRERMAVNLESGNFHPPHLTAWDDELDAGRPNAGEQRLEKAVSGMYLPELYEFLRSGKSAPPTLSAAEMTRRAEAEPSSPAGSLARALLDRSADLVAACLAGLIDALKPPGKVAIIAEGAVINRTPGYRERARRVLARLLDDRDGEQERFAFLYFEHVNLVGAAAAALME
ncbi:MAG: hypothetical protein NTV79_07270 [Candidatus Aureabacteria bacterium]|nr:hypothetical protein [Candidatus Auribacterota bacterium]